MIFLFCFLICFLFPNLEACSTFLLEKSHEGIHKKWVGKSYDWIVEDGLVIANKRSIAKKAMTYTATSGLPAEWISKYGSIVFTQAGRELPMGGMNEAGLVIELMWLDGTTYPSPDSRATLNELQWIQYQLDTASSVEEVIASDASVRIEAVSKGLLHFMVIDCTGKVAVIEFIEGQTVVHTGKELVVPVLTNSSYRESIAYLKQHQGFSGDQLPSEGYQSLDRFVRLAVSLQGFSLTSQEPDVTSVFQILAGVADFEGGKLLEDLELLQTAKWNIAYDILAKKIHFFTQNHRKMRTMRMDAFDFDGRTEVKVLDMQARLSGDISDAFIPYTYELNRNLIDRYYDQVPFLREIPDEVREWTAKYPETTEYCVGEIVNVDL